MSSDFGFNVKQQDRGLVPGVTREWGGCNFTESKGRRAFNAFSYSNFQKLQNLIISEAITLLPNAYRDQHAQRKLYGTEACVPTSNQTMVG